jgi:hypothetical protein
MARSAAREAAVDKINVPGFMGSIGKERRNLGSGPSERNSIFRALGAVVFAWERGFSGGPCDCLCGTENTSFTAKARRPQRVAKKNLKEPGTPPLCVSFAAFAALL